MFAVLTPRSGTCAREVLGAPTPQLSSRPEVEPQTVPCLSAGEDGTDSSQGKAQIISNINACQAVASLADFGRVLLGSFAISAWSRACMYVHVARLGFTPCMQGYESYSLCWPLGVSDTKPPISSACAFQVPYRIPGLPRDFVGFAEPKASNNSRCPIEPREHSRMGH